MTDSLGREGLGNYIGDSLLRDDLFSSVRYEHGYPLRALSLRPQRASSMSAQPGSESLDPTRKWIGNPSYSLVIPHPPIRVNP